MNKTKKLFTILVILAIIGVSFFIGLFVGQLNGAKANGAVMSESQTFYAIIEEIIENDGVTRLLVKGLEINDINYRTKYYFSIDDNIKMTWRGEKISVSDLDIGDNISITFTDEMILAIHPAPLTEVIKIQLLDDEK